MLHDALACIVKFSDDVCLEARREKLTLTALNLSKSAYVCITFSSSRFFSRYSFEGSGQFRERFFCQLYIRVGSCLHFLATYLPLTCCAVTALHLSDTGRRWGPSAG